MTTTEIEQYLLRVRATADVLVEYENVAVEILDGRVAVQGEQILTLTKRVASTRAEIDTKAMSDDDVETAKTFAHAEVEKDGWKKFLTVANAKKLFEDVGRLIYNKPIKAQFKALEDN